MSIDWGTLPDWLAGIGTVGTLAIAVWVLKREADDRRKREAFERGSQARAVLLGQVTGGAKRRFDMTPGVWAGHEYEVHVTNASSDATHDVELVLWIEPQDAVVVREGQESPVTWLTDVLAVGATLEYQASFRIKWDGSEVDRIRAHQCLAALTFTDMSGQKRRVQGRGVRR